MGAVIVLDVGKTLSKLSLWSTDGVLLAKERRPNAVLTADPYKPLDVAGIADWLVNTLAKFAEHPVEAIIPVAHGAAVAGIRNGVLAFTPMDYEWDIPPDIMADYREGRDDFAITGSPAFPSGLNIGAQLHYLETQGSLEGVTLMPYAQYWAWLLSGVAVSEVTSLGCHSDLWSPAAGNFSPMAKRRGWAARFAALAKAGEVIGTLKPELAALTGLSPSVRIHAGLHDSNAALVAAKGFAESDRQEATLLSTGTWFVAMRCPQEPVELTRLPEARDCLINVDAFGKPTPSARFMGGREIELLGARIDLDEDQVAMLAALPAVLAKDVMILPSFVSGSGPYPDRTGAWINPPDGINEQRAAIALYAALVADTSLDLIGAKDRLIVEGRFAGSELFVRAIATLRPGTQVFSASNEADVSLGALRLINSVIQSKSMLARVEPLGDDLKSYRARWRDRGGKT